MLFDTNLTLKEIENTTYREAEKLYIWNDAREQEKIADMLKQFAAYNVGSTAVATHGKVKDMTKYIDDLSICSEEVHENDIDDQFKGLDFG